MVVVRTDLNQPEMSSLTAHQWQTKLTKIPNKALVPDYQATIAAVWKSLGGSGEAPPFVTVSASEGGVAEAVRCPIVAMKDDAVCILWGDKPIPLPDPAEFVAFNSSGYGENVHLKVKHIDKKSNVHVLHFPVWLQKDVKVDPDQLTAWAANDRQRLSEVVGVGFESLPTFKPREMPIGDHKVIGYRAFTGGKYGTSYILKLQGDDSYDNPDMRGTFELWQNTAIKRVCQIGPTYTPDAPGLLTIKEHTEKDGKVYTSLVLTAGTMPTATHSVDLSLITA